MNDCRARAEALAKLLEDPGEPAPKPLVQAIVACSHQLVRAGEIHLALALTDSARGAATASGPEWALRIDLVRAYALRRAGQAEEALNLTRTNLANQADLLRLLPKDHLDFRITEAACLWELNRVEEAIANLATIRSELLTQPDSAQLAVCNFHLSTAHFFAGNLSAARDFALEALVSSRRVGDRHWEGLALENLHRVDRVHCRWSSAHELSTEALAVFRSEGMRLSACISTRNLGIIEWKRGRLARAEELAAASLNDAIDLGQQHHAWCSSLLIGMIRLHRGSFEESRHILTAAQSSDLSHMKSRVSLLTTEFIGDVSLEQFRAQDALAQYDRAWAETLALVPKGDIVAELRRRRAECYYLLGRHHEAYAEAKTGLGHCRELGDRYEEAATYRVLALSAAALGRPEEARQWFDQGFAYYDDIETPYEWGKLWMAYGDWLRGPHAAHHADLQGAFEAYHAAREHFERMGAEAKLAEARARLDDLRRQQADLVLPPETAPATSPATRELRKPPRRPRGSAELDRRSAWALETFGVLSRNKPMLDLLSDVGKLAAGRWPILILGESGTGKELIARGIHKVSNRAGPFMPVNCAALPREIIESELFGHVAGAFTGATRDKTGLLEACDGGTVLLDEIAEMSLELQSRLLRFLEMGELRRVGATRNIAVDTRIVAATNRDRGALESGDGFRIDLYYRLAHAVVELPPLRRRAEDIDLLISHFLADACAQAGKRVRLSDEARNRLVAFSWPGNVRQLRSFVHRLVLLTPPEGEVPGSAVGLEDSGTATSLAEELEQAERRRIVEALAQANGVRTEAAKTLGMSRTTMIGKMKRYGIR